MLKTVRKALQEQLTAPSRQAESGEKARKQDKPSSEAGKEGAVEVEGYRMEKMKTQDESTEVSSSGVEWLAGLIVLLIGLAAFGASRGGRE